MTRDGGGPAVAAVAIFRLRAARTRHMVAPDEDAAFPRLRPVDLPAEGGASRLFVQHLLGVAGAADAPAQPCGTSAILTDHDSSAILAVSDLARARAFCGVTLGLELVEDGMDGVLVYRTGTTRLVLCRSDHAGANRANAVVSGVGDELDAIVAALEAKGAAFEHHPGIARLEGNVHLAGLARLVWLNDPDGNILHINNM